MSRPARSDAGFRTIDADWSLHHTAITDIRHAVFVQEQGIPGQLEWDGHDENCWHALALLDNGRAVATGRLQADGRIGRMAVLKEWRGRGIGRAILEHLLRCASRQCLAEVYLHAQVDTEGFYRQAGFSTRGGAFPEAGILHVEMFRRPG